MSRWVVMLVAVILLFSVQLSAASDNTPTPTPADTLTYIVQPGDTLGLIASRHHTTISELARLNDLSNPQLIVAGSQLRIPVRAGEGTATPVPLTPSIKNTTTTLEPNIQTTAETTAEFSAEALSATTVTPAFDYGVEVDFDGQDADSVAASVSALGMHWAKIEARWRDLEVTQGVVDITTLDDAVDALRTRNLNVLMTITTAPDWARSTHVENGPPDDLSQYAHFASALAEHFAGRVQAYEIWNEPNLRREWNSSLYPINAEAYAVLLRNAYNAIKAVDPAATVISAGLAPTGFNDGINAVDDRDYLDALYGQGLAQFSDAVGVHPYGYANPPDSTCCAAPDGVATHYGHPSFYFLDTLNDYHAIMLKYGDQTKRLWATRFGWGTSADGDKPPLNSIYVSYTSPDQQAQYLARGFELGAQMDFMGVMIAYNLNDCIAQPGNSEACYYSLIAPSGDQRPAYSRLAMIFADAVPTPAP